MEISNSSMWDQYTNIHQQIKDREISASDGASQYASVVKGEEYSYLSFAGTINASRPTVWNGASLLSPDTFKEAAQHVPDHLSPHDIAANYRENNGNHNGVNGLSIFDLSGINVNHVVNKFEQSFNPAQSVNNPIHHYNLEADDFMKKYASEHSSEWQKAAEELDINIAHGAYITHFYNRPEGVEYNFNEGQSKSEAEMIFRHIASDNEIAQFEQMMRPAQEKLDNTAYELLEKFGADSKFGAGGISGYEGAINSHFSVTKFHQLMQDEGIDISQAKTLSFGRNDDDSFYVQGEVPNKAAIEEAINNNQDIYNLLSGIWQG